MTTWWPGSEGGDGGDYGHDGNDDRDDDVRGEDEGGGDLLEAAVEPLAVLVEHHRVRVPVQLLKTQPRVVLPLDLLQEGVKLIDEDDHEDCCPAVWRAEVRRPCST